MHKIIDIDAIEAAPLENGRGEILRMINRAAAGTEKIDLHLNRLFPGGPGGKLHRHTIADNLYIVRRGAGELRIEDKVETIREGQVVYIPAGTRHSLSNPFEDVLEIFEIYAPAGAQFDFIID